MLAPAALAGLWCVCRAAAGFGRSGISERKGEHCMNRTLRILATGVAAAALFGAAGCGSKGSDSASGDSSGGSVKTGPGITGKVITLGVLTDLSGVFAPYGQPGLQ